MNKRRRVLIVQLAAAGLLGVPAAALQLARPTLAGGRGLAAPKIGVFAAPTSRQFAQGPFAKTLIPALVRQEPTPPPFTTRLETLQETVAALPNVGALSAGSAHGSGLSLQGRLTGEEFIAAGTGSFGFSLDAKGDEKAAFEKFQKEVSRASEVVNKIRAEVGKVIVGQKEMIDAIIMAAIAGEHVLLEGVPGVAKTYTVNAIAGAISGTFGRVQGTSDMRPSDIVGTEMAQSDGKGSMSFRVDEGPIFANFFLVDEINRMPSKTQSGLLQSMQERKVTYATTKQTRALPKTFVLLATQNPIEQEGTNLLPEAQLDRFMFKVLVPNPTVEEDMEIQRRFSTGDQPQTKPVTTVAELEAARALVEKIHASDEILNYIARITHQTNNPAPGLGEALLRGASPRASLGMLKAARIRAFFAGRAYVIPEDVRAVAPMVLRHRIAVSYETPVDDVIRRILDIVPVDMPPDAPPTR